MHKTEAVDKSIATLLLPLLDPRNLRAMSYLQPTVPRSSFHSECSDDDEQVMLHHKRKPDKRGCVPGIAFACIASRLSEIESLHLDASFTIALIKGPVRRSRPSLEARLWIRGPKKWGQREKKEKKQETRKKN